jgi:NTP pyrophosphatase (non-canonical NTP hydrolase)
MVMNMNAFQQRVDDWMRQCFDDPAKRSKKERAMRFMEESVELAQAAGLSLAEISEVMLYVFDRPVGELRQEVGGVQVTLAALCNEFGIDMIDQAIEEIHRIEQPEAIERVRAKQAEKPHAEDSNG